MNYIITVLLSAVLATTVMTIFSYVVSYIFKENFKEPVLLNKVINQMEFLSGLVRNNLATGWILHYVIGIIFAFIAVFIVYLTDWTFTGLFGIGYGFVAGIVGILGWTAMFKIFPQSARTDVKAYFAQLLAAHILFGWSLIIFYNLLS